jgi:hypothetical protein
MGAPDSPVCHRCANDRLQRLVLLASRWTDSTPDSEQSLSGAHRTVRCAVRCATKIHFTNCALSGFYARNRSSLGQADPTGRGCTEQGPPKPETLVSVFCCFSNRFSF